MTSVSIIVVTYNRADYVEQLLASLGHLTYPHFEVVVVNGPSSDRTADVLREYDGRIKVVSSPVGRMTAQRNLGIDQATGDIVIFIDDDARPAEPDWLDRIVEVFDADRSGRVGAVAGPAIHCDGTLLQFESGMTSDYAFQVFWGSRPDAPKPDGTRWVRRTVGCNSAFRRSALVEVGGFDENVLYYADEADVCFRLARAGYRTVAIPDGAVRHYPASSPGAGKSLRRNYRVIARDDTYYCMHNGRGGRLRRFLTTLRVAPRKHFVADVFKFYREDQTSAAGVLRFFLWEWPLGIVMGMWAALVRGRRLARAAIPPAFLPFGAQRPERRLRVALVTDRVPPFDHIGGVERYTYDLAKGLHRLGHEVHVICRGDFGIRRDGLGFTLHAVSGEELVDNVMFPDRPMVNQITAYAAAVPHKLVALEREGITIDVVHTTNWNLCGLGVCLARLHPFVIMLVTPLAEIIETQGWTLDDGLRTYLALDRWQIEQADTICCPSWGVLDVYREKVGLDREHLPPLHRTPLGVAPFRRPDLPVNTGCRRLLFVGRLEYRKGAHVLLDALPDLLVRHPDWQCDFVGDDCGADGTGTRLKGEFLRRHAGAPWLDRVTFHGAVSDERLAGFYAACDVFVAPSLFESFGLIYPEAMQYGKPVIGCRSAGIPELITDGVDGVLVEPGSVQALTAALDALMGDAELRRRLGEAARAKVARDLDHLAMARRMIPVYESVVRRMDARARERRRRHVASAIPFRDARAVERVGAWEEREPRPGETYLVAERPGAALRFEVPGGSVLSLVTLRHDWSGVLAVDVDGQPPVYLDLFERQPDFRRRTDLPIVGAPDDQVAVRLRVQPWRNLDSRASQVWIRQVFVSDAADSPESER
ncbi:MAG TPA: glycosyltransferase [Candidatus Eisenbacteria bacterium]|nr:glycosyltransferase [Candidatus Eisenbacteria bacterium]